MLNRGLMREVNEPLVAVEVEDVRDNKDLRAFASTTLALDQNVEEISFSPTIVELGYRAHGSLLALVSVILPMKVKAESDGDVSIDFPWYSVLTVAKKEEIKVELRDRVSQVILKKKSLGEGDFTPTLAAQVLEEMHQFLLREWEDGREQL